jgi:hypothetical protein
MFLVLRIVRGLRDGRGGSPGAVLAVGAVDVHEVGGMLEVVELSGCELAAWDGAAVFSLLFVWVAAAGLPEV